MDRTLLGILTALAGALVLVGLTFHASVDAKADFRFANQTEPKTLDPQLITGQPEWRLAQALFEGLTRYDAKTMQPVPGIAEHWELSPDGKRYTFHLRQAQWTDGHPVTAQDFVYSWMRLLDPKIASEYAYMLFPVRYAEAFSTSDGHAEALETAIPKALLTFAEEHRGGSDAASFQVFLRKSTIHDPLRGETDSLVRDLLGRREGRVSNEELEQFGTKLASAARRLRSEARDARAHLGVDGGVFATDPRTLVVELRAPTPYFLFVTAFHTTLPSPRWVVEAEGRGDDWFFPEHIVSNGPYRLARWLVNDHIRLERNETYWAKSEVHLRAIDALASDNDTTAMNLYLTHELDWVPDAYPKDLAPVLRNRPDFYSSPGLSVYFYRLNTTRPPFDDKRVRLAVNLAVDRKLLVEQVLGLGQVPAVTFVPPGIAGYVPPDTALSYDVPHARALLAEAGYPEGKGFPRIGILFNTNGQHKKIAEEIAEELRRNLGIDVRAYNQEWQSFLETIRGLDYDMSRMGWIGDYTDPNTFLDMWLTNGGQNQTGWSSPLYDRLIRTAADVGSLSGPDDPLIAELAHPEDVRVALREANGASDPAAKLSALAKTRMLLLREAERILVHDEVPLMPLYFYVNSGLVNPKVRGFYRTLKFSDGTTSPNLMDDHPLRDLYMDDTGGDDR